uniref:Uncharacterized protein n=1 Tax=Rhizophora mucronata TaxID=61149 RepID=A0A2P2QXY4_RHIMU
MDLKDCEASVDGTFSTLDMRIIFLGSQGYNINVR